ncbi:LacI family DNA-binding transcriptional regulator [Naasia aerilata]|nr:LacI family DNA-binding transcriptional regulator [Naasia aerilata]
MSDQQYESGKPPAKLRDVAEMAGVSIATASKALNGRVHVHPATRDKVLRTAEKLSFAGKISSKHTGTVGLITSDLDGRFSIPILMGAEDAFGTGRVSVMLCDARGDSIREQYHLQALLEKNVDGLILVGSTTDPRKSLGHDLPVPVVYVYAPSEDPTDLSLVPDDRQAGAEAAVYLVRSGRSRIAHITGDVAYTAARDRAAGVEAALAEAKLPLAGGETLYGAWSESWGRTATERLINGGVDFDAILCGSDQIARGALEILREHQIAVPSQVAVMGLDNWHLFVEGGRPLLTSVDMNLEGLGRAAAQRLSEAIGGQVAQGIERMPCKLVVRESA